MNKKEQAEMEELKVKLALRLTDKIYPDLKKPDGSDYKQMNKGWYFNAHSMQVSKACSTSHGHSVWSDEKTSSQNGIDIFSTRLLALKAMRHEVEMKSARDLRRIDVMIEKEILEIENQIANKDKSDV